NSDPLPIPVGASSYIASGNLLNSLQNAPALAVGVIASSGEGPSYSASWDLIRITHPGPYIIDPYPDQQVFIGQPELIVPMELIFGIDGGIGSLSFEVSGNSNPQLISDITVDGTDLILGLNAILGETDLTLRATDPDNRFAESTFKLSILPEITEIAHINAGGPGFEFNN